MLKRRNIKNFSQKRVDSGKPYATIAQTREGKLDCNR